MFSMRLLTLILAGSGPLEEDHSDHLPRPCFILESCTRRATHIVVATEGEKIDGVLRVLESWKGDLKPGQIIEVPDLACMARLSPRLIYHLRPAKYRDPNEPMQVTGSRMVLFLVRAGQEAREASQETQEANGKHRSHRAWLPANDFLAKMSADRFPTFPAAVGKQLNFSEPTLKEWEDAMRASVAWIEKDQVYGFEPIGLGGFNLLVPLHLNEGTLKERVLHLLKHPEDDK